MFINNLNNNQQDKLQTLTQLIVNTHNTTQSHRARQLSSTKNQYTVHATSSETALLELESTFTTQSAKVSLLLELMSATYRHKTSHNDEKGLIQAIAWKLNISLQLLKDMECWVELQHVLTKEAKILMGEKTHH